MGGFLAVSAIKLEDQGVLHHSIRSYCLDHGVDCELHNENEEPNPATDALIYSAENGWTRIFWPDYFNVHDFPMCLHMSQQLDVAISTIHVYDGDFWEHLFSNSGKILHKFSSWPDYFAESEVEATESKNEWRGEPGNLCSFLGIQAASIRGYLTQLPIEPQPTKKRGIFSFFKKDEPKQIEEMKAYETDEFSLEDFWVFVDFWKAIGISYPDPSGEKSSSVLRLHRNFGNKLPGI